MYFIEQTYHKLFSICISKDIFQGMLEIDSIWQVFDVAVEVESILVDALVSYIEARNHIRVVFLELDVKFPQVLKRDSRIFSRYHMHNITQIMPTVLSITNHILSANFDDF